MSGSKAASHGETDMPDREIRDIYLQHLKNLSIEY
jgi:hypothetical protein